MRRFVLDDIRSPEAEALVTRPAIMAEATVEAVETIISNVRSGGDEAVRSYTRSFDGVAIGNLAVSSHEIDCAGNRLPPGLKEAIGAAAKAITSFHRPQVPPIIEVETSPGVLCRREWRPIPRVGLYAPGGSAPLVSTVLMLGIPAKLAGCSEVGLCSPPNNLGEIESAILYAAKEAGIDKIFKAGGAQAIAAMACGTGTIPKVDKIFGPGNRFVTAAKAMVSRHPFNVPVDMVAGPTELLIIADETANPSWVAADLLAQAEHGEDSRVALVTAFPATADAVERECEAQLASLPRREIARKVLDASAAVIVRSLSDALEFANLYAPEHLGLAVRDAAGLVTKVRNAGAVFVGTLSSSVFGDYASGANHTLPTGGTSVSSGGVTVESFMKPVFVQTIRPEGIPSLLKTVTALAASERLDGHARAAQIRQGSV